MVIKGFYTKLSKRKYNKKNSLFVRHHGAEAGICQGPFVPEHHRGMPEVDEKEVDIAELRTLKKATRSARKYEWNKKGR